MPVQACYLCEVEKRRNINCGIVCRRTDLYGNSLKMMEEFKRAVMKEFEMTDLGLIKYFFRPQGETTREKYFCLARNICEGDSKKIQDGELQSDSDTNEARYKTF
jgi:hypothetical protein